MTVILQRESYEYRPVTVRDSAGVLYSGTWHYQITTYGQRPSGTWLPAVSHAGTTGFVVQNLAAGTYLLWMRLDDDNPYLPVTKPTPFSVV